jgi:hypothetical protein
MKILHGRFKWTKSRKQYEEAAAPLAKEIAKATGLRWKVWAFDDEESMATGIYLFDDLESLNKYVAWLQGMGPIDGVVDFEMKVWDVQEALSKITRAPL